MAIIERDGAISYAGCVLKIWSRYWADGMEDEYATVWDMEEHATKRIQVGYYGADGCNLMGGKRAVVDMSEEVRRDIIRTVKRGAAVDAYVKSVNAYKKGIRKGSHVEVIRGRKVKKGTVLEVFWTGTKYNIYSHRDEPLTGAYDKDGNKVWICTDYLKNIDPIKSPCAAERKKFIKAYTADYVRDYGIYL